MKCRLALGLSHVVARLKELARVLCPAAEVDQLPVDLAIELELGVVSSHH